MPTRFALVTSFIVLLAPVAALAETPAELRKNSDAAVDRNLISPTAETLSAGDVAFNSYELFLAGLTVGLTDRIQVSATALLPIIKGTPLVVGLSAKGQVVALSHLRVSVQPNVVIVSNDGERAGIFGAQLLLDYIIDDEGRFVISLTESNSFAAGSQEGDLDVLDAMMVALGATAAAQVGGHVKLLAELTLPGGYADGRLEVVQEALLLTYGIRFFGAAVAADLAFIRPLHPDAHDITDKLPMGFPYVTFSARF